MLVVAAGAVNVAGLIDCRRYVTHISGTVTRIGYDFGKWRLMAEYLLVLMAFVVGAATSILPNQVRVLRGRRPLHFVPLVAVAALLAAIAIGGHFNVFGTTGGRPEEPADFALMAASSSGRSIGQSSSAASSFAAQYAQWIWAMWTRHGQGGGGGRWAQGFRSSYARGR